MSPQTVPVLIVGAGPTGCTLALLLARHGVPVVLVERDREPQRHPAACILNTRTMEVFREIGVEAAIRTACQDVFERGFITWVVSLAGRELGRCCALPADLPAALAASPTHEVQFPQHKLEPLLWERVRGEPGIDFRPGFEFLEAAQHRDGVEAVLIDPATGSQLVQRGSYLVGCDGVGSRVRGGLGIPMRGRALQHMIGVHFLADLGRLVNHRKSVLYWTFNRDFLGVLIAHWLPTEWVLFAPYFPPQQSPEDFTPAVCTRLIQAAIGTADLPDLQIQNVKPWVLSAVLAERFQVGRVFLAGDAAHCFPPTGGLGLNTGVQDAHNLAWKLAAVLQGRAELRLLDSYERERAPVARQNLEHSERNFDHLDDLNRVGGLDMARLRRLADLRTAPPFRWLPRTWQRRIVEAGVRLALGRLQRLDLDGPRGDQLRAEFQSLLPAQAPHYQSLGLDLGFAYTTGAVISEASPRPLAADPIACYRPTTWPGARLPHLWIRSGSTRQPLHDAIAAAGGFVLLIHPAAAAAWHKAVQTVQREAAMPLACLSIGGDGTADLSDEERAWEQLSEVGPSGAVLVRPDGHVAWRCREIPDDPSGTLHDALRKLACR